MCLIQWPQQGISKHMLKMKRKHLLKSPTELPLSAVIGVRSSESSVQHEFEPLLFLQNWTQQELPGHLHSHFSTAHSVTPDLCPGTSHLSTTSNIPLWLRRAGLVLEAVSAIHDRCQTQVNKLSVYTIYSQEHPSDDLRACGCGCAGLGVRVPSRILVRRLPLACHGYTSRTWPARSNDGRRSPIGYRWSLTPRRRSP